MVSYFPLRGIILFMGKLFLTFILVIFALDVFAWESYPNKANPKKGGNYDLAQDVDPSNYKTFDVLNPEKLLMVYDCQNQRKEDPHWASCDTINSFLKEMTPIQKERFFQRIKKNLEIKGYVYNPKDPDFIVVFLYGGESNTRYMPSFPVVLPSTSVSKTKISGHTARTTTIGTQVMNFGGYNYSTYYLSFLVMIYDAKDDLRRVYSNLVTKERYSKKFKVWEKSVTKRSLIGWSPKGFKEKRRRK